MKAFEFSTIVKEGNIRVPDKYLAQIKSPVKVIVLAQDYSPPLNKKKFTAMSLDTRGYKFDRDEANER